MNSAHHRSTASSRRGRSRAIETPRGPATREGPRERGTRIVREGRQLRETDRQAPNTRRRAELADQGRSGRDGNAPRSETRRDHDIVSMWTGQFPSSSHRWKTETQKEAAGAYGGRVHKRESGSTLAIEAVSKAIRRFARGIKDSPQGAPPAVPLPRPSGRRGKKGGTELARGPIRRSFYSRRRGRDGENRPCRMEKQSVSRLSASPPGYTADACGPAQPRAVRTQTRQPLLRALLDEIEKAPPDVLQHPDPDPGGRTLHRTPRGGAGPPVFVVCWTSVTPCDS